jgi:ankyrin repeat protein
MDSDFVTACSTGDLSAVKKMIKKIDYDALKSGFHFACVDNKIDIVEYLITNSADLQADDDTINLEFKKSLESNLIGIAKKLLEYDNPNSIGCINIETDTLYNCFEYACKNGQDKIIGLLIGNKKLKFSDDNMLMKYACESGNSNTVVMLLEDKKGRFKLSSDDFYIACRKCSKDIIKYFLKLNKSGKIEFDINSGYFHACKTGNVDVIKYIIKNPDINNEENRLKAFKLAVNDDNVKFFGQLFEDENFIKNIDLDELISSCIEDVCKYNAHKILNYILKLNNIELTPEHLDIACQYGSYDIVKTLLDKTGIDPSSNNNKVFISACENGNYNIVKKLLQHTNVDPTDNENEAFVKLCEKYNGEHWRIVKLLVEDSRIDPSAQESLGFTYLCEKYGNISKSEEEGKKLLQTIKLLMKNGKIDPTNGFIVACDNDYEEIVKVILRSSKVSTKIAKKCLKKSKNEEIIKIIESYVK